MNNNRGNNRRRGRGNNRQSGGGQQVNRIDSRARGNAPQLLEKYRKLAHDAHLNGDRVNEEYYLQFADHYFRVIADARARQEESRPRRDERWQDSGQNERDYGDDAGEFQGEDSGDDRHSGYERRDAPSRTGSASDTVRAKSSEAASSEAAQFADAQSTETPTAQAQSGAGQSGEPADEAAYEPAENPFLRPTSSTRGIKPRRPRRDAQPAPVASDGEDSETAPAPAFDPAILPPSINVEPDAPAVAAKSNAADSSAAEGEEAEAAVEDAPKPRRRTRRTRPVADETDEPLRAVN